MDGTVTIGSSSAAHELLTFRDYRYVWIGCVLLNMDCDSVPGHLTLSSNVAESGRQFACDGELVTFTCEVNGSFALEWNSPSISENPITYTAGFTVPGNTSRPPFFATLISITGVGSNTDFISTLQVNASNDTTVQCSDQKQEFREENITVSGRWHS